MAIPKKPKTTSRTSTTRDIGAKSGAMSKADIKKAIMERTNFDKPIIKKAIIQNGLLVNKDKLEKPIIKKADHKVPVTNAKPTKVEGSTGNNDDDKIYSPSFISKAIMVVVTIFFATLYFIK